MTFFEKAGIRYPIIQAPMLGVSTPEMAAAVSEAGGLGSLAVGGLSPEVTRNLIRQTRALTGKPFAVNLFTHHVPVYTPSELEPMKNFLAALARERGYTPGETDLHDLTLYTYRDLIPVLSEEKIPIVSFTFGRLDTESTRQLKTAGSLLMGTATSPEEALLLESDGVDAVCIQGIEAGGHRGSFLEDAPLPRINLQDLLAGLNGRIHIPLIAAGGIHNRQTLHAAFAAGAEGVQIGTAFINCRESVAIPAYRARTAQNKETGSVLTRAFSGRWARGIPNGLMQRIENAGIDIPPYPLQNSLTGNLRRQAQKAGDGEYTNLWAGQFASDYTGETAADIFRAIVNDLNRSEQ